MKASSKSNITHILWGTSPFIRTDKYNDDLFDRCILLYLLLWRGKTCIVDHCYGGKQCSDFCQDSGCAPAVKPQKSPARLMQKFGALLGASWYSKLFRMMSAYIMHLHFCLMAFERMTENPLFKALNKIQWGIQTLFL